MALTEYTGDWASCLEEFAYDDREVQGEGERVVLATFADVIQEADKFIRRDKSYEAYIRLPFGAFYTGKRTKRRFLWVSEQHNPLFKYPEYAVFDNRQRKDFFLKEWEEFEEDPALELISIARQDAELPISQKRVLELKERKPSFILPDDFKECGEVIFLTGGEDNARKCGLTIKSWDVERVNIFLSHADGSFVKPLVLCLSVGKDVVSRRISRDRGYRPHCDIDATQKSLHKTDYSLFAKRIRMD